MRGPLTTLFSMAGFVCLAASTVQATSLPEPLVDAGLANSTPAPDADLVVVRERFYGSQEVDLTPYGIGTGADNFVQSFYFRLYPMNIPGQENTILGTVTFPPGVRILGFITNGGQMGSTTPNSPYTQSDALFAVSSNPNEYVAPSRGFEVPGTGAGSNEFICQINERSFYFGMDVLGVGADDFRVIVDYGVDFAPSLTFEVNLYTDKLGGVAASTGIRVGAIAGGTPGEGDYGEITHLVNEPLTTDALPISGTQPPVSGRDVIYMVRENGATPEIDAMDVVTGSSMPGLVAIPPPFTEPPRAVAFGENGLLYVAGNHGALSSVDTVTGDVTSIPLPVLPGVVARMTTVKGDPRVFFLRQTSFPDPEDAWVDTYDTVTGVFTPAFATFPTNVLPFPVDLIGAADGRLYALGVGDAFHGVNIQTGAVSSFAHHVPNLPGDNVRGTADPYSSKVYLLRDTPSGDTYVDVLDTTTGAFQEALFSLPLSIIPDVGAMVLDNYGMLWVFGKNGGTLELDPASPSTPPIYQTACLDFPGTTNYAVARRYPREVSPPAVSRQLDVNWSPQPGQVRISWEDLGDPGLAYNLYTGSIGSFYSHAPAQCRMDSTPGAPGSRYMDFPTPAGDTYFLVTASDHLSEGSAGPLPISVGSPACGPIP